MLRIVTNYAHDALPMNHLALIAHFFYRRSYFHLSLHDRESEMLLHYLRFKIHYL